MLFARWEEVCLVSESKKTSQGSTAQSPTDAEMEVNDWPRHHDSCMPCKTNKAACLGYLKVDINARHIIKYVDPRDSSYADLFTTVGSWSIVGDSVAGRLHYYEKSHVCLLLLLSCNKVAMGVLKRMLAFSNARICHKHKSSIANTDSISIPNQRLVTINISPKVNLI